MAVGATELGTFSSLLDEAVRLSGRGVAARVQLASYARASMREPQVDNLFEKDLVEDILTFSTDPYIWERPAEFRLFRTVKYTEEIYPKYLMPGRRQHDVTYFYYAASTYYTFKGLAVGDTFGVAYYKYFPKLVYFDPVARPARYFADLGKWQYLDGDSNFVDTLGSDDLDEAARALVTNWMLFDWTDLVMEGILAKQFKVQGDDRARSHFALYKSMINDLLQGEVTGSIDR